jgi:hypothetical protein
VPHCHPFMRSVGKAERVGHVPSRLAPAARRLLFRATPPYAPCPGLCSR